MSKRDLRAIADTIKAQTRETMSLREKLVRYGMGWAEFLPELNIGIVFRHLEETDERVQKAQRELTEARRAFKAERKRTMARLQELYTGDEIRTALALAVKEGK